MPAIRRRVYQIHPLSGREVWKEYGTPEAIIRDVQFYCCESARLPIDAYECFKAAVKNSLEEISKTPQGKVRLESGPGRVIRVPARITVTNTARLRRREKVVFAADWQTEDDGVKTIKWSVFVAEVYH